MKKMALIYGVKINKSRRPIHSFLHPTEIITQQQTEKYLANRNLLVLQFFCHTTPFYNFKTQISKPNEKVNQGECKQCFHSPILIFSNFQVLGKVPTMTLKIPS